MSSLNATSTSSPIPARKGALIGSYYDRVRALTGRLFAWLLAAEWITAIAVALVRSPTSWDGQRAYVHPHVWAALVVGALATILPVLLVLTRPSARTTRHVVAIGQMTFSALFIHLSDGRIESHFHVFGSLAFLAFYRDPAVLLTASAVVIGDHAVLGTLYPMATYGIAHATLWRTVEHAAWVAYENLFLAIGIVVSNRDVSALAGQRAQLEATEVTLARVEAAERELATAARMTAAEHDSEERLLQTRARFLAALSHELRTPLNAIVGSVELLVRNGGITQHQRELVGVAHSAARHMVELVNDILDHAKIESGRLELDQTAFEVGATVSQAVGLVARAAEHKQLTLTVDIAESAPKWLVGDALRVRQVIVNLLSNAIKFTRHGGVRVLVRRVEGGPGVRIDVEDDGMGISDALRDRIFEPYRQADRSTAGSHGGTGLGLAISRQLARAMGGDLTFDSVEGLGTTFHFVAPLPEGTSTVIPTRRSLPHGNARPMRSLFILLADDDGANRTVGKQLLTLLGHRVDVAEDGQEAVTRAMQESYDLVLMDAEMPKLDGLAATRALRNAGKTTPILGFTGHSSSEHAQACTAAGMNGVVHKPIEVDALVAAITRVTEPSSSEAPPAPSPPSPARTAPPPPAPRDIDLEQLQRRVGGDPALYAEVLAAVVTESHRIAAELDAACSASDCERVRRAAHTLRGCVANVGAATLVALLRPLEDASEAGDVEALHRLGPPALASFQSVHAELVQALDGTRSAA